MDKARVYTIVFAHTLQDLEIQVNQHLASGWDLQGGVSIGRAHLREGEDDDRDYGRDSYAFAQAMIKTDRI
jgi:hypothetical protein